MAKKDNKFVDSEKMTAEDKTDMLKENKKDMPEKQSHFGRNLLILVFLLLGGAAAYSSMQLKQTEAVNKKAMDELQQSYEQKLNAVSAKVNGLKTEIDKLKNKPAPAFSGVSEEYLNQRLAQLQQEFMRSESSESGENPQVLPLSESLAIAPANQAQEVLLASGAMIVRDLAEQGNKFEYEAEVLQILAQGNPQAEKYVDIMQKYAASGIKGKNQLIKSFNKIFADLNEAKVKTQDEKVSDNPADWKDKAIAWLKKIFVSKKGNKRPVFKEKDDEVYTLVNEGNLGEALNALKISEKYSRMDSEPLAQWQKQVEDYLEFKRAATGVIMNSIANLHLKEMEH